MDASRNNDYNELLQSFPADDHCVEKNVDGNNQPQRQRELEILTARKKIKIDFTRINYIDLQ